LRVVGRVSTRTVKVGKVGDDGAASGGEVAETEVSRLLRGAGGSYVRAYEELVRSETRPASKGDRLTAADRQSLLQSAVESMDLEKLAEVREKMAGYVELVCGNAVEAAGADRLMGEFLALRDIDDFLKVRRERIREAAFNRITESLAAEVGPDGEPLHDDPENENGRIEVPELGKAFAREGCGPRDADLDQDALRAALGDLWLESCDMVAVFSPERLMKLVERDPSILEKIRGCFTPGGRKSPRFVIRNI
jgi:hypothetical protein